MNIEFLLLKPTVKEPFYATSGSAGFDLVADNFKFLYDAGGNDSEAATLHSDTIAVELRPGARLLVGLGFKVAIPAGYEMQIRPRSGMALKQGVTVLNSPGTIDSDYRGEVGVILINHSRDSVVINTGDKIAQGVITEIYQANFRKTEKLSDTYRGVGGFGSTGKTTTSEKY